MGAGFKSSAFWSEDVGPLHMIIYIYTHINTHLWITLLYIWNLHYIVNHLYFKNKKSLSVKPHSISQYHSLPPWCPYMKSWTATSPIFLFLAHCYFPSNPTLSPPSSLAFAHSSHFLDSSFLYVRSLTKAPWWSSGKESTCQCRRCRFDPWVWKILGVGNANPFQYSCLENSMDREAWWATVHVMAELDTTEQLITN